MKKQAIIYLNNHLGNENQGRRQILINPETLKIRPVYEFDHIRKCTVQIGLSSDIIVRSTWYPEYKNKYIPYSYPTKITEYDICRGDESKMSWIDQSCFWENLRKKYNWATILMPLIGTPGEETRVHKKKHRYIKNKKEKRKLTKLLPTTYN
jgi:hypothetical protein